MNSFLLYAGLWLYGFSTLFLFGVVIFVVVMQGRKEIKNTKHSDLTRYTLVLDKKALDTVERLRQTYGLKNNAEVLDLAKRMLVWVAENQAAGIPVGRNSEEFGFQELLLPPVNPEALNRPSLQNLQ